MPCFSFIPWTTLYICSIIRACRLINSKLQRHSIKYRFVAEIIFLFGELGRITLLTYSKVNFTSLLSNVFLTQTKDFYLTFDVFPIYSIEGCYFETGFTLLMRTYRILPSNTSSRFSFFAWTNATIFSPSLEKYNVEKNLLTSSSQTEGMGHSTKWIRL